MNCETCHHEGPHELGICLVHLRRDLAAVDEILSRRDALDAIPNRLEKIAHAIGVAKKSEKLEHDLAAAQERIAALMDTVDALKAAIDDGLSALNSSAILLTRVVETKEALLRGHATLIIGWPRCCGNIVEVAPMVTP